MADFTMEALLTMASDAQSFGRDIMDDLVASDSNSEDEDDHDAESSTRQGQGPRALR